jgi:hypothetical protein
MRSAKRVILSLVVALTILAAATRMQAGQANTDKPPQATPGQPAGAQFTSCVVKITVDPAIMPLNPGMVEALVFSSGVAGKAAREVLHIDALPSIQEFIEVEWLAQDVPPWSGRRTRPPAATSMQMEEPGAYDEEMLRQMEQIYGEAYMKQFQATNSTEQPKDVGRARRGASPQGDTQPTPGARERGRTGRRDASPYGAPSPGAGLYGNTMGYADRYHDPAERAGDSSLESSTTIKLTVHLPSEVTPAAGGFAQALVQNLRATLLDTYSQHIAELNALLRDLESRRRALETGQGQADTPHPEDEQRVQEQLDTVVDLSMLRSQMPLNEIMDILRKSVEPRLQIVVLWRDLEQNAQITPALSIDMEGLFNVRVRTALEVLLKALDADQIGLSYQVKGNVITIGTAETLSGPAPLAAEPGLEADVGALAARKYDLAREIQALQLDLATMEARQKAIEKQIAIITNEAAKRADQDEITRELDSLVKISTMNMVEVKKTVDAGRATPVDMSQAQESLTRAKIELARRREELGKSAGGGQVEEFNRELSQMTVEKAGKLAQRELLGQQFAEVQRDLAQASAFDPAAARMRIVREALDIMARRMTELQTRLANLQPPTVTMIGAN